MSPSPTAWMLPPSSCPSSQMTTFFSQTHNFAQRSWEGCNEITSSHQEMNLICSLNHHQHPCNNALKFDETSPSSGSCIVIWSVRMVIQAMHSFISSFSYPDDRPLLNIFHPSSFLEPWWREPSQFSSPHLILHRTESYFPQTAWHPLLILLTLERLLCLSSGFYHHQQEQERQIPPLGKNYCTAFSYRNLKKIHLVFSGWSLPGFMPMVLWLQSGVREREKEPNKSLKFIHISFQIQDYFLLIFFFLLSSPSSSQFLLLSFLFTLPNELSLIFFAPLCLGQATLLMNSKKTKRSVTRIHSILSLSPFHPS